MSNVQDPSPNDALQSNRDKIRQSLKEITSDISSALFDARLVYPMYVCVPSSGALLTIACPLDPDDAEWDQDNGNRAGNRQKDDWRDAACSTSDSLLLGRDNDGWQRDCRVIKSCAEGSRSGQDGLRK